ncbi:MAG: hypothetical protein GVY29_07865 [Spirochaetes bacterium]|jgi:hypothetical protein|nr:hypothetical protein [Spirochaetota bacterium]
MSDEEDDRGTHVQRSGRPSTEGGGYYHYDRDERLALRPDRHEPSRGILKGNRSLTIILLDVLIVAIIFLIFRFAVFNGESPPAIMGYTVAVDLLETSGGVLGLVTLEAGGEPKPSSGIFTVRMTPSGSEGASSLEVKDLLPDPQQRRRVSELFPDGTTGMDVVVQIDEETLELRAELDNETGESP